MVLVVWGDFTQSPCTWNLIHHKIHAFSFTFSSLKKWLLLKISCSPDSQSGVRWRWQCPWKRSLAPQLAVGLSTTARPRPNSCAAGCQSGQGAVRGDPLTTHGTAGNLCVVNCHVLISRFPGNVEISRGSMGSLWRRNCSLRNIEIIKHGFELWQSLMLTTHGGILECSEYRANFYIFQWILKFLKERWWWMLRLFCSVPDVSDVINW